MEQDNLTTATFIGLDGMAGLSQNKDYQVYIKQVPGDAGHVETHVSGLASLEALLIYKTEADFKQNWRVK